MTHLYIKICDLYRNPAEINSQIHARNIRADIIVRTNKKYSLKIFNEDFDICVPCLKTTGLYEILKKMKEQKYKNKGKEKNY